MKYLQSGTTLIEVLITLLVVSIGLLGMASFQLRAVRLNTQTFQYMQATNLANEIADSIVVNPGQAAAGDYSVALANQVSSAPANSVAQRDLTKWLSVVSSRLPSGLIVIEAPVDATASGNIKSYNITVCWQDDSAALALPNTCGAADKALVATVVNSRL
jgi:type IV pilus assembly protein PilV